MDWLRNQFGTLEKWAAEKAVDKVVAKLDVENKYEDRVPGNLGKIITWLETQLVVGDLLRSLGDQRGKLYEILTQPGPDTTSRLLGLPQELPPGDPLNELISGYAVHKLHSQLLHPPTTYLGNRFQFRSADGSDNNILYPQLGKAGTPYAKSVPSLNIIHGSQPDPGDLFDILLSRDETDPEDMRESNLGISSMLLYHATVIIHDIFRTNTGDKNISDTSSYLDLTPLYGKDEANQKTVRSFQRGLLKPDTFAEERLLNQPVGVCIYLIMYNRFHNYVAQQLLEVNENGKFLKPPSEKPEQWTPNANWQPPRNWMPIHQWQPPQWQELDSATKWSSYRGILTKAATTSPEAMQELWRLWKTAVEEKLDEDLFQTARLITCGMYINISIHDYLRVLMRVHLKDTSWTLDPRKEIPIAVADPRGIQRGKGNQVSVEFNVLYRFHSPLSRRDVKWTENFLKELLQGFVPASPDGATVTPKGETNGLEKTGGIPDEKTSILPSLSAEQLEKFDIPIPVMGAALQKMYAMLPKVHDKVAAPAFPLGLDPLLGSEEKGSVKYRFERDPKTQKFDDLKLAQEMVKSMEDPICEFGAKNTAKLFRSIEILGILQARKWELASLNEFRKFFGLPVHETFEDINAEPKIANKLKNLYRHPDQVELYPGLVCEGNARCIDPGTEGPKSATALWRAVFSDAVTLVRSDRFYNQDWNVGSLTGWGMREVTSIPEVMKGSVMHRLFQRAFPRFFSYNSLHLWQPFHIPAINYILAKSQGHLTDLENLSEMGLEPHIVEQIENLEAVRLMIPPPKEDEKKKLLSLETRKKAKQEAEQGFRTQLETLLKSQIKVEELKTLEGKNLVGYTKIEVEQIREIKIQSSDDAKFAALQLAFKPLKRAIRMPNKKFEASKPAPVQVTSYETILNEILAKRSTYKNPGYLDRRSVPKGPLGAILTGELDQAEDAKFEKATQALREMIDSTKEILFAEYFSNTARSYLEKGSRDYQKLNNVQVWQVDIVSDYAMPVVAKFVTDFLGFWDWNDPNTNKPVSDARVVYNHLSNCQDYLTYNSDELTVFPRRIEFRASIDWLKKAAEYGIRKVHDMEREKEAGEDTVSQLRHLGTAMAKTLLITHGLSVEQAAAIRLAIALDAVHKSVLMFTEVLHYLLHKQDGSKYLWEEIQNRASRNEDLSGYVLEAQRLAVHVPLIRQVPTNISPLPQIIINDSGEKVQLSNGTLLLIEVDKAQQNAKHFPEPLNFNPDRNAGDYLIYGRKKSDPFTAKHLTIIAVTALIKKAARLAYLRRAHNNEGRINMATTPDGVRRYLTQEFDQLVPFPTTWQLRYNAEDKEKEYKGVYKGQDNSQVGYGMEQVYQDGALSAEGGSLNNA